MSRRLEVVQDQYRELSFRDSLTGLYNKRYLGMKLGSALKEARDGGTPLSLLLIDLDDLKGINDSFGHDGGDEFVIILPGINRAGACRVAERIRSRFVLDSFREKERLNPTISLGVAEYLPDDSPESLQKRADEALYEAKRLGKDRFAER